MKHKKRPIALDRKQFVKGKIQKLLEARLIYELKYTDYLVNIVLTDKSNGDRLMCVNFIGLNTYCPKDNYPLPISHQLVAPPKESESGDHTPGAAGGAKWTTLVTAEPD